MVAGGFSREGVKFYTIILIKELFINNQSITFQVENGSRCTNFEQRCDQVVKNNDG